MRLVCCFFFVLFSSSFSRVDTSYRGSLTVHTRRSNTKKATNTLKPVNTIIICWPFCLMYYSLSCLDFVCSVDMFFFFFFFCGKRQKQTRCFSLSLHFKLTFANLSIHLKFCSKVYENLFVRNSSHLPHRSFRSVSTRGEWQRSSFDCVKILSEQRETNIEEKRSTNTNNRSRSIAHFRSRCR